jgi:hypothetical protein
MLQVPSARQEPRPTEGDCAALKTELRDAPASIRNTPRPQQANCQSEASEPEQPVQSLREN